MISIKSERELCKMREAGRHVGEILLILREMAQPGRTTGEIDRVAAEEIRSRGLDSSFLGYAPGESPPYPAVVCTSLNEEVVHGIPGGREIKEGDLLKLDFGAIFEGFHGDSAVTVAVGAASKEALRLVAATRESLYAGISEMRPRNRLGDVSNSIQRSAEGAGYSVVRQFVGHGIGRAMHEPPQVPNFGERGRGPRLRPGMVLALEPMVNLGTEQVEVLDDQWTAVTADRNLSCHFEHTVAVTDGDPEILTQVPGGH